MWSGQHRPHPFVTDCRGYDLVAGGFRIAALKLEICSRNAAFAGQMPPTRLHVEIMLLPVGIVSLIGIPTALVGKLTAVENFVAEIAANFQSRPPQTEGPEGARVGDPPGPLAAPSLAVEATADYDTQGAG